MEILTLAEKYLLTREFFVAGTGTIVNYVYNKSFTEKRNIIYHVSFFFLIYFLLIGTTKCEADEVEFVYTQNENSIINEYWEDYNKEHVLETPQGCCFSFFESSGLNVERFIEYCGAKVPSREELIQKLVFHKQGHDDALRRSEDLLIQFNLLGTAMEDLYQAARISVGTYAGTRNFLTSAIIAIIDCAFEKALNTYTFWPAYNTEINNTKYHAEMFDFYMDVLIKIYHC